MEKVAKQKNFNNTDIINVTTDEGSFSIFLDNDSSVWFKCKSDNVNFTNCRIFLITKNNYFLYKCFHELYESILDTGEHSLIKNGRAQFHSDIDDYDSANVLSIEIVDDTCVVMLGMTENYHPIVVNYSVCINSENSSRYYPYNGLFLDMYNKLCEHDFEYEQITMDEYMDRIKVRKR